MIVAIQGSKDFDDYAVFMRSMAVALSSMGDSKSIELVALGPKTINNFVAGFANLSEDGMKARGMTIKHYAVAHQWIETNIEKVDYFVYLSKPDEHPSRLVRIAESVDCEVGLFRY